MLTIPLSLCVYNDMAITVYPVETGLDTDIAHTKLKNVYIVGIRNKNKKIVCSAIFLSSIENNKDGKLAEVVMEILKQHSPTEKLIKDIDSMPTGKIMWDMKDGSIVDVLSESELNKLYFDFYLKHSVSGNA
ncbi:negative control protein of sporulation [Yersinia nurmii]|uniref:Negative control protein of sporulation n=1 Tax=Yersinia nurmii TaxID=685706 RepID=A0AAW7KB59_9GAMM|nr:negative control protein of sporulation [Yersinia nurmii]MDN0089385.1 negative control protein of sporulation [Yersinia nurmii]